MNNDLKRLLTAHNFHCTVDWNLNLTRHIEELWTSWDLHGAQDRLLLVPRTEELTWMTFHKKHLFPCFLKTNKKTSKQQALTSKCERLQRLDYYIPRDLWKNLKTKKIILFGNLPLVCVANIHFHFLLRFSFYFLFQVSTYQEDY